MRQLLNSFFTIFFTFGLLFFSSKTLWAESVVISATDYPPYEFANPEGGLRGFDVEVTEAAFERVGFSSEFKFFPWKRALEMTRQGNFTGILSCNYNDKRAQTFFFSTPISRSTDGYFVRKDHKGYEPSSFEGAKGIRVGAILGWVQGKLLTEGGANVVEYRSEELAFRDLLKGVVDYILLTREGSGFRAMQLGISNKIRFLKVREKSLYLCISKKWPNAEQITQKFNEGLAAIQADGTYDAIHSKYR